jgi:hypothetical protein
MEFLILLAVLAVCGLGWEVQRLTDALTAQRQCQKHNDPYDALLDTMERERWHRKPPPPQRG